ncbi:DUF3300 domain-containing protein [Alloacidobacterium dinghuense]|uniref:DUF3300 domain-containing protein n=1 Tax=Alloacidobacterium dinghuense TaxID=2763107 RepID=A0A7G8BLF7_9BACT|nr:DUF3300 domain-containing protein [Alloacidobacterium dinghuense]QNI33377.1 DUF3300 domain-containing protein [Alloacidobacterium dinghuense]
MPNREQALSALLCVSVTVSSLSLNGCNKQGSPPAQAAQGPATTYATPTADQLYQLVAPIALFPDNLLAQVLAGSTFPDQISAAYQWLQQNASLKGQQLMQAVNQQSWDASVKGLTQFPDVLKQMSSNLSWTSALGDAYFNVPQSVMNAVQVMRQRAYSAGSLKSNQQQNVSVQNQAPGAAPPAEASSGSPQVTVVQPPPQTIVIQPSQPNVVYVPTYNPTVVYGAPVAAYPGYSTADLVATSLITFGVGMAIGAAMSGGCCGWGWNSWGCGWHNSSVTYNRNTYISTSNTFVNRNNYYNRNNYNNANINRNDINRNDINRNNINRDNYRANNFNNNARTSNFTTPSFNQRNNQPQFQNNRNNVAQNNRQPLGSTNQPRFDQQNRPGTNQQNRAGVNQQNRTGLNQTQNRANNFNQPQRDPARGYGQQADRGTNSGAFSNYSQGGNARTNSARGQESLAAANRPQQNVGGNAGANRGNASRPQQSRGGAKRR